jgi:sialic acid synthase SpsE
MVRNVRTAYAALGQAAPAVTPGEAGSRHFRRSLFAVRAIRAGEPFTSENVRSIRPGDGLPPRELKQVLGRQARTDIARGTPLRWDMIGERMTEEG